MAAALIVLKEICLEIAQYGKAGRRRIKIVKEATGSKKRKRKHDKSVRYLLNKAPESETFSPATL